jgi:hypothetical protein
VRVRTLLIAGGILLAIIMFGHYGRKIAGAYGEAFKVQLHLDETNVELEALKKRVNELEDMKALDEQRIAELEAATWSSPLHR